MPPTSTQWGYENCIQACIIYTYNSFKHIFYHKNYSKNLKSQHFFLSFFFQKSKNCDFQLFVCIKSVYCRIITGMLIEDIFYTVM